MLDVVDRGDQVRRLRDRWAGKGRNAWLQRVRNVVHVGANTGQEAALYARHGLGVLWIEPIPSVYRELVERIRRYPGQTSHNALVADVAGKTFTFHVSNNSGASSSIYGLAEHRQIWPTIEFEGTLELVSETLDGILARDQRTYDALVVTAQGAELLVLKGSMHHLQRFRYIQARAPDFNAYDGCATVDDLTSFLSERDFKLVRRDFFAEKPGGTGTYFDLLFTSSRNPPPSPPAA